MPAHNTDAIQTQLCGEIQTLLSLPPNSVLPETSLQSLGLDSLRFVSLLIIIEQKFGVSLIKVGLRQQDMQSAATLAAAISAGQTA
jgi:acyl carrier protein